MPVQTFTPAELANFVPVYLATARTPPGCSSRWCATGWRS